jgi:hypothetical protein
MARLAKAGTLGLLLFGGGVLALLAGFGRVLSVDAETQPATQASVPGVAVYVNDFELPAVAPSPTQNKAPATTTGANPADNTTDEADIPSVQARMLTDAFSKTLVETLRKNGFTATRVREKPGGKGVLLRGVFAEPDAENRIRRVILGAGAPNPQFFLYVGTFNLKSPDQPLYEPAAMQAPDPRYGPVITPNAYIPMEKFQIAKHPTQEDVQKVCTQIAQNLNELLQANKAAFVN